MTGIVKITIGEKSTRVFWAQDDYYVSIYDQRRDTIDKAVAKLFGKRCVWVPQHDNVLCGQVFEICNFGKSAVTSQIVVRME